WSKVSDCLLHTIFPRHHGVFVLEGENVVVPNLDQRGHDAAPVRHPPAWNPEPEAPVGILPGPRWNHTRRRENILLELRILCMAVVDALAEPLDEDHRI